MKAIYETPVPSGWTELPLAKVVETRRGYTWEKDDETSRAEADTIPVIRIPNIRDRLDLSDLIHLRNVPKDAIDKAAVTKDWLLFVGSNGTQDRIGDSVLIDESRPMVFASFLVGMRPRNQKQLRSDFLSHWMRLHLVHEIFSKTSQQTSGLANFSWGAVKRLPLRFPVDCDEQRRISDAFRRIDVAIQKAQAELASAKELFHALLKKLFEDGITAPQGIRETKWLKSPAHWTVKKLKRISSVQSGFTMGRDLSRAETVTVPYVTVVNVQDGRFDLNGLGAVEIKKEELDQGTLCYGDILMTEGGDRDKLGRGSMWRGEIERCAFQNHIFRVRLDGEYKPELFHFLIQTFASKRYFYSHAKQSSNLCTINSRELKNWEIAIPSPDEQRTMIDILQQAERNCLAAANKFEALRELKRSMTENLLTGQIRIPSEVFSA
jgi:type I restriction enzyme S subunit